MLAVAVPKRNKLQNIIVLTPKDGAKRHEVFEIKMNIVHQHHPHSM